MSFSFDWPRFSDQFHYDAIQMLNTALNKGNKPPIIADKIEVVELEMGTQPPELEIRDIGDLTLDQFRGIFRLTYAGDAHLVLKTQVQANPLNHKQPDIHLMGGSRGMLAAKQPLVVPMLLRLSHFRLSSYVVLVVSKQKGITLVFKTDPLQHVDINSTFDSIAVIQSFIQREIEGQLRQMFREDLPGIIHRLSQQWVKAKVEAPYQNPSGMGQQRAGFQLQPQPPQRQPSVSKRPSLSSLGSRRPRASSNSSSTLPSFPSSASSSFSTAPSSLGTSDTSNDRNNGGDSSPTLSSHPELENFDPTYGLRPEGLPTKSVFKAFSSLFTPNKGLADLAEESMSTVDEYEYDEDEDDEGDETEQHDDDAFDIVDWDDRHSLFTSHSKEKENQAPPVEYETIPAVGGGTITRPRVYHSQSVILSSTGNSSSPYRPTPASATLPLKRSHTSSMGLGIGPSSYNPYFPDTPLPPNSAPLLPSVLPASTPSAGPSQPPPQGMRRRRTGMIVGSFASPDIVSQLSRSNSTDSGSYFSASVANNGEEKEGIYMRRPRTGMANRTGYATPPLKYPNGYTYPYPSPSPYPQQHNEHPFPLPNRHTYRANVGGPGSRPRRSSVTSNVTADSMATRNGARMIGPSESASNYADDVEDLEEHEHRHLRGPRNGFDGYEDGFGYNSRPSSPTFPSHSPNSTFHGNLTSSSSSSHISKAKQRQASSSQSHPPQSGPSLSRPPFKPNLAASATSIHQLSTLSTSNHTLSPYTRDLSHFTVRSVPPRSLSLSTSTSGTSKSSVINIGVGVAPGASTSGGPNVGKGASTTAGRIHVGLGGLGYGPGRRFGYGSAGQERQPIPVKARRKRIFKIGGAKKGDSGADENTNGHGNSVPNTLGGAPHGKKKRASSRKDGDEFDVSDMDRYFTHELEPPAGAQSQPMTNSQQSTIRARPSAARGAERPSLLSMGSSPVAYGSGASSTPAATSNTVAL